MTITKEALEQRLAELEESRARALSNIAAHNGAIEETQRWIASLDEEEAPPPLPRISEQE